MIRSGQKKMVAGWMCVLILLLVNTGLYALDESDAAAASAARSYYISSSSGNDENDGLSEAKAWRSFSKLDSETVAAGSRIYLKRGDSWDEQLVLQGVGTADSKIILDAYGEGSKPIIKRGDAAKDTCVLAKNLSYWTVRNLELRNSIRGLHLKYDDVQAYNVEIRDCDFYDMNYSSEDGKIVGVGLCIEGDGKDRFYNAVVSGCNFVRCVNGFAINIGTQNLLCENCFATGGLSAGFALVNVRNSVVRKFVVIDVGGYLPYGTCGGFIVWSEGVTIDSCEFANCQNGGGHDGVGFDFEGNSKNITFTNNVIHGNAGAGIMVMSTSGHNSNIVIKDNLLYNNCTSASSDKASYEMLCWDDGSTGTISNCRIFKKKAVGYIHENFRNFRQSDNKPFEVKN